MRENTQSLRLVPAVLLLGVGAYMILDHVFFLIVPGQRFFYGAILVLGVLAILLGLKNFLVTRRTYRLMLVWLSLALLFCIPVLWQTFLYPGYVVGDLASILCPLLLILVGLRYPEIFTLRRGLLLLSGLLLLGVILGMAVGQYQDRFEAPVSLLFVVGWSVVLFSKNPMTKLLGLSVLVVLLVIAFASGERTSVVLWIISLLLTLFVVLRLNAVSLIGVGAALLMLVVFGGQIATVIVQDIVEQSRFSTAATVEEDQSLLERYDEARDVLRMLQNASFKTHLLGHGHGAAYQPHYSYIERNVTRERLVHNVHFGPLLVYFRYGLIGAVLYLGLLVQIVRGLLQLRRDHQSNEASTEQFVFTTAVTLYFADWMLRNVLVDPVFSYVMAGFLTLSLSLAGQSAHLTRPSSSATSVS